MHPYFCSIPAVWFCPTAYVGVGPHLDALLGRANVRTRVRGLDEAREIRMKRLSEMDFS
ncbi:hypothetical protein ACFWMS_29180 [Peribacillus butanolivorans]|uniref:hypothetical protein n=1 Tax=Peribacillus butanolivorans TaxID=421767 RepID=UPI00365129B4